MLAKPTRGSLTRVRSRSLSSTANNSPSFSCLCGFGIRLLRSWLDALLVIGFDQIAHFEGVEFFENDAAFVATGNFAHIVFAASQRSDFAIEDQLLVACHTRLRRARDLAIQHATPGNHEILACLEDLLYLGMSFDDFAIGRLQHTCQRGLNIIKQL